MDLKKVELRVQTRVVQMVDSTAAQMVLLMMVELKVAMKAEKRAD